MRRKDPAAYKAYMKEYMLRRYHERMAEARSKLGNKCAHCGAGSNLEFDHINPDNKSHTIGKMWSLSKPKI
jgi:hypothetical protein